MDSSYSRDVVFKGENLTIGHIKGRYRYSGDLDPGPYDNAYRVVGVLGHLNGKDYVAKISVLNKETLAPLSLSRYREEMNEGLDAIRNGGSDLPSVARIEDFSVEEIDDKIYSCKITEFIEEPSLAKVMGMNLSNSGPVNKRMEGNRLKDLFQSLADELSKLHNAGIFHGNLKPQNIFPLPDGSIKLTDPDVSQLLGRERGRHLGTEEPASRLWISPEQNGEVDHRIGVRGDIWSLGIILFELLGGAYPYHGDSTEEMAHNMLSPRTIRKELRSLPDSLNSILDSCLNKDISQRCKSAADLSRQLAVAEFIKSCAAGHPNQYWEMKCNSCALGFSRPGLDKTLCNYRGWIEHKAIDKLSVPVDGEIEVAVKIWPSRHPNFADVKETGDKVSIKLSSPDDEAFAKSLQIIHLLPPPRIDISNPVIEIERQKLESEERPEINIDLMLRESKIAIQRIDVEIDGQPDIATASVDSHIPIHEAPRENTIPIRVTLDRSRFTEMEAPQDEDGVRSHDLTFILHLKNRPKPLVLDHQAQLKVIDSPKLVIADFPKSRPIHLKVYRGVPVSRNELLLGNVGGGKLDVVRIDAEPADGRLSSSSPPSPIRFHDVDEIRSLSKKKADTKLEYTIAPEHINGDSVLLNLTFHLRASYRNRVYSERYTHDCIIDAEDLKEGRVLAIDFGTTNSMCAAFVKSSAPEEYRVVSLYGGMRGENSIPSAIQYFSDDGNTEIGRRPARRYREGHENTFRSFKPQLANREKWYNIYPSKHSPKYYKLRATDLTLDFYRHLYTEAVSNLGREFTRFVFTHPTLFWMRKMKTFRKILDEAFGNNYELLDEATAAALHYISEHKGAYRLVVYDFGGGTIDVAYLYVNHSPDGGIDVTVIDANGLPNFGGDNITRTMVDLFLTSLLAKGTEVLLEGSDRFNRIGELEQKEVQRGQGPIWSFFEGMKVDGGFFDKELTKDTLGKLWVWNPSKGRCELREYTPVAIKRGDVYREIYSPIQQSIEMVMEMLHSSKDFPNSTGEPRVLLSGHSSKIPLVVDMFEAYRKGERPFWNEEKNDVEYHTTDDARFANICFEKPRLSTSPKECVVKGAAFYPGFLKDNNMTITGSVKETRTRIGMCRRMSMEQDIMQFQEWIPRNRKLVPGNKHIESDERDSYAIGQKECRFAFINDKNGESTLLDPIDIYEFSGQGDSLRSTERELVGVYTFRKPEECPSVASGLLRLEVSEDLDLRVRAKIGGEWIDAYEIESES